MPFQWADYLKLASLLAAQGDEAALRSAISRAYYAVYHTAVANAQAHSVTIARVSGFGLHESCWNAYKALPATAALGVAGDRLKVSRHKADYQLVAANWAKEAATTLTEAARLMGAL